MEREARGGAERNVRDGEVSGVEEPALDFLSVSEAQHSPPRSPSPLKFHQLTCLWLGGLAGFLRQIPEGRLRRGSAKGGGYTARCEQHACNFATMVMY
jgi:hypothetical protein